MHYLKILKTATITANVAPGEIILPPEVNDESRIEILLEGGYNADLQCREKAGSGPYIKVYDDTGAAPEANVTIWQGRAKGAPRFIYAAGATNVTYTILLMAQD